MLDKAKQATSEVFDKAKDAADELSKPPAKSTDASPAPNDPAPNDKGPRDKREPQPEPQKWH